MGMCAAWGPSWMWERWGEEFIPPKPTFVQVEGSQPLLFPGEVHIVYGRGGQGKTWFSLAAVTSAANAGLRCVIIDYEGSEELTRFRLKRLGLTAIGAANVAYQKMLQPVHEMSPVIAQWASENSIALVVVDSYARALAAGNMDENLNSDVARFMQAMEPLRSAQTAVLLIDHVKHQSEASRESGAMPYPRGASTKVDQVAIAYYFEQVEKWAEDRSGYARLVTRKDRFGVRAEGEVAAQMNVFVSEDRMDVRFVSPTPPKYPGVANQRAAAELLAMVTAGQREGLAKTAKNLAAKTGQTDEAARHTLDEMVTAGHLVVRSLGTGLASVLELPDAA